jgi:hypothetical protein
MAAAEFERPKARSSLPVTDQGENAKCTARSVNALRSWVVQDQRKAYQAPSASELGDKHEPVH